MVILYWPEKLESEEEGGEVHVAGRGVLTEVLWCGLISVTGGLLEEPATSVFIRLAQVDNFCQDT